MADEKLNVSLQENLITLLSYDDKNGRIIANLLDPALMEGDYRTVAERAIDYWRKFDEAPKGHLADELADIIEDPKNRKARTFKRILQNIMRLQEGMNADYVMDRLRTFTRMQRIKDAVIKSAEQLNSKQEVAIEEVEKVWNALLRTREMVFDAGVTLLDVEKLIDFVATSENEFALGIHEMDRFGVGPVRGGLFLWLAPTGRGKSWGIIHTAKQAVLQRKKVLHISLEMSAEEVMHRYYQAFFAVAKREAEVEVTKILTDKNHKLSGFDKEMVEPEFTMRSEMLRDELVNHIRPFGRKFENLRIKRFPTRGIDVDGIRAYLDNLEITENFIPDMLALDYAGILKTDPKNHRISLGRQVEDLRGLCVERNMAGVSAMQVSKEGAEALTVSQTHVSEDWSVIQTADGVCTLSSTDAEFVNGLARLYVNKFRGDKDHFGMLITQKYAIGQFVLQSVPFYTSMLDQVRDYVGDKKRRGSGSGGFDDRDEEDDDN